MFILPDGWPITIRQTVEKSYAETFSCEEYRTGNVSWKGTTSCQCRDYAGEKPGVAGEAEIS
ncbi:hypothetical protein IV60_GL001454 [Lancefieldella rimae]|uniref:Uncharacterized protein n=2 Tax=Lancefieldella rimae TaxID=1383 RepID=B9CN89_LANR4|nr:hypothetical protein ATORI0001_1048 [Lancefieldella rimae ATCC 49626]KRO01582.1 hypothetical protein IV60_GL001454 [Lancefieldella rimae]